MAGKVLIAGAGASGLMAAVTAARAGAEVTVLEAMERPGRKLLLTGNGRCNLTNMDPELPLRYYGSGRRTAQLLTGRFGAQEARHFFEELGLLTTEKNGYVYPCSMQASAVLESFLTELRRLHVKLKLKERVRRAWREDGQAAREDSGASGIWKVQTDSWRYEADALILACGSKCLPETGSDGTGYRIAAQLGHTVVRPEPALAPVTCEGSFLPAAAGVRSRAAVSLYRNKELIKSETGELQWTKYGVSGIVVFQLSRFIENGGGKGDPFWLSVDLLPEFERAYLADLLKQRVRKLPKEHAPALLGGMLHHRLIPVVLAGALQAGGKTAVHAKNPLCGDLTDDMLDALAAQIKDFRLRVTGTKSFDSCQVCRGGVDCGGIFADTLESRLHPNLYFTGELLDVDGPCGGYNLQWAWASGAAAGNAAAQKINSCSLTDCPGRAYGTQNQ